MFGNDIFTRVKRSENKKMAEIAQFLHENDLELPEILLNALLSVNPFAVKDWR